MSDHVQEKLRGVLAGEHDSVAWLYDTFAPGLFRRLSQRYGYPGGLDPDDVLQDTFLLLLRHQRRALRRFVEREGLETVDQPRLARYLWNLACGVASNRRRRVARRTVVPLFEDEEIVEEATAERQTVERDQLERLDACLRQRSSRIYLYYLLRHRDGLLPEAIARATGWSMKATYKLKQTLDRAVALCAEQLGLDPR